MLNQLLRKTRDVVLRPEPMLALYLKTRYGANRPAEKPRVNWENHALSSRQQWQEAAAQVRRLGLPPHPSPAKNWDSLAALHAILSSTTASAIVLDAGGEKYSQILPWLYLYGYRNLTCINLSFAGPARWGPISFEPGDITRTRFANASFDAVTCLSVIEHGVDVGAFLAETRRILKPGGILALSMDYYPEPIDTRQGRAFGAPLHIFDEREATSILETAAVLGLRPTSPVQLACSEKAVHWEQVNLDFSYLTMTLRKQEQGQGHGYEIGDRPALLSQT